MNRDDLIIALIISVITIAVGAGARAFLGWTLP